MADRQYVGKGKQIGNFGHVKFGIKVSDLKPNDKGYVNLVVGEMKSADKWGNTHTVWVDDYVPGQRSDSEQQTEINLSANYQASKNTDDSLPF